MMSLQEDGFMVLKAAITSLQAKMQVEPTLQAASILI